MQQLPPQAVRDDASLFVRLLQDNTNLQERYCAPEHLLVEWSVANC